MGFYTYRNDLTKFNNYYYEDKDIEKQILTFTILADITGGKLSVLRQIHIKNVFNSIRKKEYYCGNMKDKANKKALNDAINNWIRETKKDKIVNSRIFNIPYISIDDRGWHLGINYGQKNDFISMSNRIACEYHLTFAIIDPTREINGRNLRFCVHLFIQVRNEIAEFEFSD